MTRPILTRVYNQGDLGNLACGWRSLIALPPGRKWITLLDWTTLERLADEAQVVVVIGAESAATGQ